MVWDRTSSLLSVLPSAHVRRASSPCSTFALVGVAVRTFQYLPACESRRHWAAPCLLHGAEYSKSPTLLAQRAGLGARAEDELCRSIFLVTPQRPSVNDPGALGVAIFLRRCYIFAGSKQQFRLTTERNSGGRMRKTDLHRPVHHPMSGDGYQVRRCGATRQVVKGVPRGGWHVCKLCVVRPCGQ